MACELRHPRTTTWFIEGDMFSKWKWSKTSSLLWINGKRLLSPAFSAIVGTDVSLVAGAGKTILWYVDFSIFSSWESGPYCVG
jgi:hypothetical protein